MDQAKCQVPASLTPVVDVTADSDAADGLHGAVGPDGSGAPATSEERAATSVERVKTPFLSAINPWARMSDRFVITWSPHSESQ